MSTSRALPGPASPTSHRDETTAPELNGSTGPIESPSGISGDRSATRIANGARNPDNFEGKGEEGATGDRRVVESFEGHREDGETEDDNEDPTRVLEHDPDEMATWIGQPSVKGSSDAVRMILLTFTAIGITFTWGVEMTYCTPYLLNLGLTKSNTSLVWIAGPLSGLITQPIVGAISDASTSKWGRRRPFIALGAITVALSLLTLGFTKEVVGAVLGQEIAKGNMTIVVAVLAIYVTDFAVNTVMSTARGLLVDVLPIHKQQSGAAWYSRMAAFGHVLGYGAGSLDLVSMFGTTVGDTQFKQLTIIAAIAVLSSCGITCWAVTERILVSRKEDPSKKGGRFTAVWTVWSTLLTLPPRIRGICWAFFWSWIGWFPFLFYSTTWVGETYFRYDVPADQRDSKDALGDIGRIGSTSLAIYSTITLIASVFLPAVVKAPDDDEVTSRPPQWIVSLLERFERFGLAKPDLLSVWMWGHLMFSATMFLAPFAKSYRFATFLVAMCGVPWAINMWAPATFLGVEVNRLSGATDPSSPAAYRRLSNDDSVELTTLHLEAGPDPPSQTSSGELSGIYFGILNIFATIPQFIGTFISSIVFALLEPGKSPELTEGDLKETDGPNAIAVCLFIGAVCTIMAAVNTRKLKYM